MKLLVILLTATLLTLNGISFASDENTRNAAAENMLTAMKMEATMHNTIQEILKSQLAADPCLQPFEKIMSDFLQKYFSWTNTKDNLIKLYAAAFTEDEMKEITKFYKTPVGKKTLEKTPQLAAESMQMAFKIVNAHKKELTDQLEAARKKIDPATLSPECKARFEADSNKE